MKEILKIKSIKHVTHDVLGIVLEKPAGLTYIPGQAADISVNKPGWEERLSSFTFTSLPDQDQLEFTIKTYPSHNGVTNQLLSLSAGDELILHEVFGDIAYKGEGIFIAGGAGVTPFIAIFKELEKEKKIDHNKLIFANKTKADIILKDKFEKLLGSNFINILSAETVPGYEHGFVSPELIKKYIDEYTKYFYLCGPDPMIDAMEKHLASLGIKKEFIVREGF